MAKKILVTGASGFIGFHLIKELLSLEYEVVGIDNINNYYDVNLKYGRLGELGISKDEIDVNRCVQSKKSKLFRFSKLDLNDRKGINNLFAEEDFQVIINLAAQPGVRYSLENPYTYVDSNLSGFLNVLEGARNYNLEHFIFASSSSVYGLNESVPFSVNDTVDHPISLYGATKKANELMAHSYSHLFNIPTTGLRFFTVYGEWGRPDMAYYLFTKAIYEGNEIKVFNNGAMERDFTYVADIVKGIVKVAQSPAKSDTNWSGKSPHLGSSSAPFRIYNIGNNKPVKLLDFIAEIEKATGIEARKKFLPIQPGDVVRTWADITDIEKVLGYNPSTTLDVGIPKFVTWYKEFYNIK